MRLIVPLLLMALMLGCGDSQGINISEKEFGDKWPITAPSGRLVCTDSMVIFTTDGISYGINGLAKSNGYANITPIWKDDPQFFRDIRTMEKYMNMTDAELIKIFGKPTKIDIGPLLDNGLALCK